MWAYYGNGTGWMGWGMGLFWLIVAVVVVIALTKGLSRRGPEIHGGEPRQRNSAMDILDERYARGEIDRLEYEQKKRDIQG